MRLAAIYTDVLCWPESERQIQVCLWLHNWPFPQATKHPWCRPQRLFGDESVREFMHITPKYSARAFEKAEQGGYAQLPSVLSHLSQVGRPSLWATTIARRRKLRLFLKRYGHQDSLGQTRLGTKSLTCSLALHLNTCPVLFLYNYKFLDQFQQKNTFPCFFEALHLYAGYYNQAYLNYINVLLICW